MDSKNFDALTRRFVTRRAGASLALAGLLGIAVPVADAKKKHKKKKCKPACGTCQTCNKGKCKLQPNGTPCVGDNACYNGACTCPVGQKPCGTGCIATNECCTNGAPGCLFPALCTSGTCTKCLGNPCVNASDCCTGICAYNSGPPTVCTCRPYGRPCKSDKECCGGACLDDPNSTGKICLCGRPGAICSAVGDCCSNVCKEGTCQ